MIVVALRGGLGNQLFQFAKGYAQACAHDSDVFVDTWFLDHSGPEVTKRVFDLLWLNVPAQKAPEVVVGPMRTCASPARGLKRIPKAAALLAARAKGKPRVQVEAAFEWSRQQHLGSRNAYLLGYWQSPKYFQSVSGVVRSWLKPSHSLDLKTIELRSRIASSNGVCINVRRGDFVSGPTRGFHGLMSPSYYREALKQLPASSRDQPVYVFSDEPEWCNTKLDLGRPFEVIMHDHAGPGFSHYLDLMQACSYFVIPNSTFGWWAAWGSGVPGSQIVAPLNWFADPSINTRDLVPSDWLRY
jgi:hypothetical protein